MALGAPPGRMLAGIFARSLWQIAAGVVVGVTAALVLHRSLNIEMAGGWHIPGVLPAAAIFIMTIGLLSAAGPAHRAVRVNPTEALRDG
jgi:ABC-type antimicrobial peptide transport system permease subunit